MRAAPTSDDCHLRSCRAVIGHHIHATDGDIGHVEDFLVDEHYGRPGYWTTKGIRHEATPVAKSR